MGTALHTTTFKGSTIEEVDRISKYGNVFCFDRSGTQGRKLIYAGQGGELLKLLGRHIPLAEL